MTVLYLDSNALAKLYLDERTGRDQVLELLDLHEEVACCLIGYAEVAATIARYFHEGTLDDDAYRQAMNLFTQDWESVRIQPVTPELTQVAALLTRSQRGLRAMDALHLASALALRTQTPIQFLTFDQRLLDAAGRLMPDALA